MPCKPGRRAGLRALAPSIERPGHNDHATLSEQDSAPERGCYFLDNIHILVEQLLSKFGTNGARLTGLPPPLPFEAMHPNDPEFHQGPTQLNAVSAGNRRP